MLKSPFTAYGYAEKMKVIKIVIMWDNSGPINVKFRNFNKLLFTHLCRVKSCLLPIQVKQDHFFFKDVFFFLNNFHRFAAKIYANIVYPDQTPRYSAFDLGLHCLRLVICWMG